MKGSFWGKLDVMADNVSHKLGLTHTEKCVLHCCIYLTEYRTFSTQTDDEEIIRSQHNLGHIGTLNSWRNQMGKWKISFITDQIIWARTKFSRKAGSGLLSYQAWVHPRTGIKSQWSLRDCRRVTSGTLSFKVLQKIIKEEQKGSLKTWFCFYML